LRTSKGKEFMANAIKTANGKEFVANALYSLCGSGAKAKENCGRRDPGGSASPGRIFRQDSSGDDRLPQGPGRGHDIRSRRHRAHDRRVPGALGHHLGNVAAINAPHGAPGNL
jgi:hypothetical protein